MIAGIVFIFFLLLEIIRRKKDKRYAEKFSFRFTFLIICGFSLLVFLYGLLDSESTFRRK